MAGFLRRSVGSESVSGVIGHRSLAAKRLGIGRRTLYDKIARHGISLHPTA